MSKGGCLPGDAVAPWADAVTAGGSEQCNHYVVDLAPFAASRSTTFGMAPLLKTGKSSPLQFSSFLAA